VTGTNSETVWFHLVMKTAQNLGMTSGTYGWFANSALLSQPDLSATFGASLEGFVGLRAPWTMNEGDQRTAFQARWQAAYASAPESVYGIPSSLIGERRYNAVWRIARALHDFEELKTYCTDDARNTSVYARIAQYPNSSCTATPTVWPAADTQEQLCCIMARADLGHHVTSQSKQSAAEKQDMWWSRAAVLSRLLWNRSSVDAEGDAGFGWSTKNGMTVNAFQIVNIVKGGAAQVVGMYGLSSSGVGSNQSVQVNASQIVWMGGATMRPADDVMITRRVRENSLGLVAIILLLAGACHRCHLISIIQSKMMFYHVQVLGSSTRLLFCTSIPSGETTRLSGYPPTRSTMSPSSAYVFLSSLLLSTQSAIGRRIKGTATACASWSYGASL